jgi:hypothetical protein
MSKKDIKQEINKVLDKMSDQSLNDLLSFLKNIETKNRPFLIQTC